MQPAFWKTTFIYGLGFLGLRMISFLLLPLYTHLLSPSDTGVVFIVYTVLAFLNTVYSRGMDSALIKFYDNSKQPSIISTSILYSIKHASVLCALLLMIIWVCSLWGLINLSVFSNIIILGLLLVLFFDMLSSRCMTVLRLQERPFYYLFASFTSVVSNLLLNIYLIKYLNMGLQGALWAIIVASIIQIIILVTPGFKGKSMPALTLSAAAGGGPQHTSPIGDAKGRRHSLSPGSRIPSQRRRHEALG